MIILGINDSHDASACIVKDGKILHCVSEERIERIKSIGGFPHRAIEECLQSTGIRKKEIDQVAIATNNIVPNNLYNTSNTFSIADHRKKHEEYFKKIIYENKKIRLQDVFPDYKPVGDIAYPINKIPFSTSSEIDDNVRNDIKEMRLEFTSTFLGISKSQIHFYNHHRCHALYAYYINSNRKDNMVIVTSDAGGDGSYTSISVADANEIKCIHKSHTSLIGKIYTAITLLLGMRPNEHEYKVMGLAPYASKYQKEGPLKVFEKSLKVSGLNFEKDKEMKDFFFYYEERLKNYRFDGIAGALQEFVENLLTKWFEQIYQKTNIKDFVYSGGVANNVKANKVLLEQHFIDSLFVPVGPGDESLSVGAAYAAIYDNTNKILADKIIEPKNNAYWGADVDSRLHDRFNNTKYIKDNFEIVRNSTLKDVATIIAKGEVVALLYGNMEFGARALGHRSLVADPSSVNSVRKINDLIKKRDFWMPFTPSILDENFDNYVVDHKKSSQAFMTVTYDTTALGRTHLAGAIHPYDYTVRPQRVTKETCSTYHGIISEFKKLTGVGALLNTSLNIHGKPIVSQPTDLLAEILYEGIPLNYLYIQGALYKRIGL